MSSGQQDAVNQPVTTMGLGIKSNIQGTASGNNSLATVRKLVKVVLAEKAKRAKKTKKKKLVKKSKDQERSTGAAPAIQLPSPIDPKGIA
jgi:hypothetical protein